MASILQRERNCQLIKMQLSRPASIPSTISRGACNMPSPTLALLLPTLPLSCPLWMPAILCMLELVARPAVSGLFPASLIESSIPNPASMIGILAVEGWLLIPHDSPFCLSCCLEGTRLSGEASTEPGMLGELSEAGVEGDPSALSGIEGCLACLDDGTTVGGLAARLLESVVEARNCWKY